MEVVEDVYEMGENVAQRSNPFFMLGRGLGFNDEKQKEISKGKLKVSSPHLKVLGQKDIKNYKEKK